MQELKKFERIGSDLGRLVQQKNEAYGSSWDKTGKYLSLLYPDGIQPNQYDAALLLVRIFDKCMRVATDNDPMGETPFLDIAGYGILGSTLKRKDSLKGNSK